MKKESILVVEDNTDLCSFIEMAIKRRNIECKSANRIADAMATLENFKPSTILLDIILPDGFSLELLDNFHEKCPEARLIIMTGWEKENILLPEYVHGWLYKPFNEQELFEMLNLKKAESV